MQIMFENGIPLKKRASIGDYTIKKKDKASLGSSNKLEKKDVSVMSQKELPSLNDKRPLPPKPYDPSGQHAYKSEGSYETKPVKKVRTSPDTYFNKTLPLENKPIINEVVPSLKNLFQNLDKSSESEKKSLENPRVGFPRPPEPINKPKQPNHSLPIPSKAAFAGNEIASDKYVSNKLKYLPHVQSKESKFGNFVVPVLPSFLTEGN